jgi:endonuclease IV
MIGIHVAKNSHVLDGDLKKRKTMLDAIVKDCTELHLNACQIFVQGPRNSRMSKMDYGAINKYCSLNKIKLFVHSSYITVGMFSITPENQNEEKAKYAKKSIIAQLTACDALGSHGLVVHISKRTPSQILSTFKVLMPILKNYKTPIILEQPAKKADGDKTYETPEKINNLTKILDDAFPKYKWGWCIDTCHLWAAGIKVDSDMRKWLSQIKQPKKIVLFHLNGGMKKYFGTGKDTHIIPFSSDDAIWDTKSDAIDVLKFAKKYKVPCILEINRGSKIDSVSAIDCLR